MKFYCVRGFTRDISRVMAPEPGLNLYDSLLFFRIPPRRKSTIPCLQFNDMRRFFFYIACPVPTKSSLDPTGCRVQCFPPPRHESSCSALKFDSSIISDDVKTFLKLAKKERVNLFRCHTLVSRHIQNTDQTLWIGKVNSLQCVQECRC